ncbi:hypothetical protein J2S31_001909 [Nitrospina gracilis Nb-211]|nr:hypothetical protein [Nitrospina gracilis Nb-211]
MFMGMMFMRAMLSMVVVRCVTRIIWRHMVFLFLELEGVGNH